MDSTDPANQFVLKYSDSYGNLTANNFEANQFNTEISVDDLVHGSSLTPPSGGEKVEIHVDRSIFLENTLYNFALKAKDESDNWSAPSNIARVYLEVPSSSNSFDSSWPCILVLLMTLHYSF